jgi:hypothetical protein
MQAEHFTRAHKLSVFAIETNDILMGFEEEREIADRCKQETTRRSSYTLNPNIFFLRSFLFLLDDTVSVEYVVISVLDPNK